MGRFSDITCIQHYRPVIVLVGLLGTTLSAVAVSDVPERERLAAITRQLDQIERLADTSAGITQPGPRYHFDYGRFRIDLRRIRAGVQDYLTPQRAQPRDMTPVQGDYTRDADDEPKVPAP